MQVSAIGKSDPGLTQRLISVLCPVLETTGRRCMAYPPAHWLWANHPAYLDGRRSSASTSRRSATTDRSTRRHDIFVHGPTDLFRRTGYLAPPEKILLAGKESGVVVLPGGDYDAYRPTFAENVIDFNGRKDTSALPSKLACPSCRRCPMVASQL